MNPNLGPRLELHTEPQQEAAHTPTPWYAENSVIFGRDDEERNEGSRVGVAVCGDELEPRGGLKYGPERDANTEFILRACNAHTALVEALIKQACLTAYYNGQGIIHAEKRYETTGSLVYERYLCPEAKAALKLAGERP